MGNREISGDKWKKAFRRTWELKPVTQITPSEKEYNRAKEKQEVEDLLAELDEEQQAIQTSQEEFYGETLDGIDDWDW